MCETFCPVLPVITFPILQPVDGYTATGFLWARARPAISILSGRVFGYSGYRGVHRFGTLRCGGVRGGNTPQDTPKTGSRRREDHVRHHDDMPAHVGQEGAEPVRKTVRHVLDDLTFCAKIYARIISRFFSYISKHGIIQSTSITGRQKHRERQ